MKNLKLNTQKLRAEMERQGLANPSLGALLKTTRQSVWYYFHFPGNLSLKTVSKIGDVLNVDPKDLLI